ncbi:MAG: zf-HC2 domain-containing protein [Verrucomicrobia bacterium]|nr:zf-HC2 domain-containing protein [Verrucomicrobiota bacterium]MDA1085596.1 zf-HC2 domain-containing protein [Verrucomicrobiota bacterium]
MNCSDIQNRLTDYISKETTGAVSDTIRIHLESCPNCRTVAKDLNETLDILKLDSEGRLGDAAQLTEERREEIVRAYTHPVIHWVETHHILVSIIVALTLILLAAAAMIVINSSRDEAPEPVDGVEVWIGPNSPNGLIAPEKPDSTTGSAQSQQK